jgi:uncharacterized protein (DUF433 family)
MALRRPTVAVSLPAQLTVNPTVRGGVPCVGSENWPIAHILEKLASGQMIESLIQENLELTVADIQMTLETAAWVMRDPAIEWSKLRLPGMVELQRELQVWQSLSDDALGYEV